MKEMQLNCQKKWEDRSTTVLYFSPNEASSTQIGLHLIIFMGKGVSWECPNNTGCSQDSSQIEFMAPLLKITPTHFIDHR